MKKCVSTVLLTILLTAVLVTGAAAAVSQGEFAFALARRLGLRVDTIDEAVKALNALEIKPRDDWNVSAEMTDEVARDLEIALAVAMAELLIDPVYVEGAMGLAAADTGFVYNAPLLSTRHEMTIPWYAPIGGPLNDPVFIEGEEGQIPPQQDPPWPFPPPEPPPEGSPYKTR